MNKMTGKKSIVLGYSLSALHLVDIFSKLSESTKEEKVKQLVLVGPPFLGAWKSLLTILGGDP